MAGQAARLRRASCRGRRTRRAHGRLMRRHFRQAGRLPRSPAGSRCRGRGKGRTALQPCIRGQYRRRRCARRPFRGLAAGRPAIRHRCALCLRRAGAAPPPQKRRGLHHAARAFRRPGRGVPAAGRLVHNVFLHRSPSPQQRIHPTQKPESPISEFVTLFSSRGGLVLDPFAGSATTLAAGVRLGRRVLAYENDPRHFEASVRRLEDLEPPL